MNFKGAFKKTGYLSALVALLCNLAIAYVLYFLARMVYLLVNYSYFEQGLSLSSMTEILRGGLVFDTSAILVTHIPYIVLLLLTPWRKLAKWVFVIVNAVALAANLADSVYFRFTMRRTTTTVFSEFQNENNLLGVFGTEMVNHWYLVLLFVALVYVIWKLYRDPGKANVGKCWWRWYPIQVVLLAALAPFVVAGIRGGFATAVRPITISNANQYVDRPTEAALVLNTPFSIYRTIGKNVFVVPSYFDDPQEMETVYSPIHHPSQTSNSSQASDPSQASLASQTSFIRKNVVVLIVESFGCEYIGALNKTLENGCYKGYTPYVDSLIAKSVTFSHTYCNGRKSIDGMPSILSSIPMFVEPFFLTPASMNQVGGVASILGAEGYQTAFFHGAQRGSMGFQAFSRTTGFKEY